VIASRVNPRIPTDYHETGEWLEGFVRSNAKREDPRLEALLEAGGAREGKSYGVRLILGGRSSPPLDAPPIELRFQEVAEGRSRFDWCAALGERIHQTARELLARARAG
jgi:hypothetical protein